MSIRLRDLKPEYLMLWETCQIRPEILGSVKQIVRRIEFNRGFYLQVQQKINVPWHFIAVIHNMESSLDFTKHLHNGDSLKRRTVNVPSGRPIAEPINGWDVGYSWEEGAIDALKLKELDQVKDWSLTAQLWQVEQYNGFGYRLFHPEVLTPYLWSGTNHYSKGKYVLDGKWDADKVSFQIGVAALLKVLIPEENLKIALV